MFYRWLYNVKIEDSPKNSYDISNWRTADFVNINKKKTKRLSPIIFSKLNSYRQKNNMISYVDNIINNVDNI